MPSLHKVGSLTTGLRNVAAARAACTVCHRRKVRCDAHEVGTPCTNCSKHGSRRDNCRIHEKGKRPQRRSQRTPLAKQVDVRTSEENEVAQKSKSVGKKSPSSATTASLDELGFSILDASARESDYLYKRHLVEFVDQPHIDQRPIDKNARTIYIGKASGPASHFCFIDTKFHLQEPRYRTFTTSQANILDEEHLKPRTILPTALIAVRHATNPTDFL